MVAASSDMRDFAGLLIESHADLNVRNKAGDSALGLAIQAAQTEMTELLLGKGASLQATPYPTREAVMNALRDFAFLKAAGEADLVRLEALLQQGAPVNFRDRQGRTALMHAADSYSQADRIVSLLLAKGAGVAMQDDNGNSALMLAAEHNHHEIVELLLKSGAEVNTRNKNGRTALFNAAESGDNNAVVMLLGKGAEVETRDDTGKTPLIVAANGFGGRWILPALLAKGAEINAADHDGRTALMNAAVDAQDESVQLLLARGADVNARTKNGLTAVKLVRAAKTQPGIPQLFVEHLDEIIAALRKAGATD